MPLPGKSSSDYEAAPPEQLESLRLQIRIAALNLLIKMRATPAAIPFVLEKHFSRNYEAFYVKPWSVGGDVNVV